MKKQQDEILAKQQILEDARQQLKQKFIGIDKQIDQVVDACTSWYLLPEYQQRPVIINLWGMTGTGKTDMVSHLINYLNFKNFSFSFDMSSGSARWDIDRKLSDFSDTHNGEPLVLLFDEFQNARGINEKGIESQSLPLLWKLLDSGTYYVSQFATDIYGIRELTDDLDYAVQEGVKAQAGLVTSKIPLFKKIMAPKSNGRIFMDDDEIEPEITLVPPNYYGAIYRLDQVNFDHLHQVERFLATMDELETLTYLHKLLKRGPKPKEVDCSKALIFVLGNLDEAYSMASDFSVELDADLFHQQSLKIDMLQVKNELRSRFRFEQIARLGNNHIIYPALSRKNYQDIIALKLQQIASKFEKKHGLHLSFSLDLHHLLYREGVIPSQGTRPILSTIQNLISDKLSLILVEVFKSKIETDHVYMDYAEKELIAKFKRKDETVHHLSIPVFLQLEPLRKSKKDDLQAITAAHEAGHAVASIFAEGLTPEVLISQSIDRAHHGFIHINRIKEYWSYTDKLNLVCNLLAGREAERLLFGSENLTSGAENDLAKATHIVSTMFRKSGMGRKMGSFSLPGEQNVTYLRGANDEFENEIQITLEKASQRAREILQQEYKLFLHIAAHLADHNSLDKKQLIEMVKNLAIQEPPLAENFAYRKKLMGQLAQFTDQVPNMQYFNQALILNKNN